MSVLISFNNGAEMANLVKALLRKVASTMPGSVEKAATREVWNINAKQTMEALMQGSIVRVGRAGARAYYATDEQDVIEFPGHCLRGGGRAGLPSAQRRRRAYAEAHHRRLTRDLGIGVDGVERLARAACEDTSGKRHPNPGRGE